jgi:serine/threonine protein kinase
MTQDGVLLGTAAYVSPEQARGQVADKRADIWAFGVVLMEMLTGHLVYQGDTVSDTLAGIRAREPEWEELPEETPRSVRQVIERGVEKSVSERLRDIGEARLNSSLHSMRSTRRGLTVFPTPCRGESTHCSHRTRSRPPSITMTLASRRSQSSTGAEWWCSRNRARRAT